MFVQRKDEERQQARRLRVEGWSLARIARELGVAKSSVSVWVRGLEFDHIGLKRESVTRMAWYGCSLATIDAEIAKCDIRCANCHRRVTARRGGHFRFRVLSSAVPP
jgi:transposase-like protein